MTNPITDIDGRTVLVGVRKLYLDDENPSIGIGIYDDDQLPTRSSSSTARWRCGSHAT